MAVLPSLASAKARPRRFFFPSTILVLLADLIPLAGVIWWGWDAFVLLMLYWLETTVIAFWSLVRILTLPLTPGEAGKSLLARAGARIGLTIFFLIHASGFMAGHLLFLWLIFSGKWGETIHGPRDFLQQMVLPFHLWAPLGMIFVARGLAFAREIYSRNSGARTQSVAPAPPSKDGGIGKSDALGGIVGGLYGRIVLMHVTIIAGVWVAQKFGSIAPFVLLIAIKTLFDVLAHVSIDLGLVKTEKSG